MLLLSCVLVSE